MQIVERRVAGAKVIDLQIDPQCAQLRTGINGGLDILHKDTLGDLQFERAGQQPRFT